LSAVLMYNKHILSSLVLPYIRTASIGYAHVGMLNHTAWLSFKADNSNIVCKDSVAKGAWITISSCWMAKNPY
ncbi:hypothetical protein ACXWQI_09350, partial [Streptococcus pyogenes]